MSKEESTVEDLYNLHKSGEFDSNIKKMKLKDIKPNPNNPRVLRDDKFQKLKQSITEFPKMLSLRPMVIDENNVVLGGNMRLRALQELGFTDVEEAWVKRSSDLTEDEKKRFIIADNVAFGEWDWDTLANDWEVVDLEAWGLEIPQFDRPEDFDEDFTLPEGDKEPFQQMTFTLADEQATILQNAIADIKKTEEYKYCETMGNENSNGNALYLIIKQWEGQRK